MNKTDVENQWNELNKINERREVCYGLVVLTVLVSVPLMIVIMPTAVAAVTATIFAFLGMAAARDGGYSDKEFADAFDALRLRHATAKPVETTTLADGPSEVEH